MKQISVIIPCYNAENLIEPCLTSIVNQTIGVENLEIILVNDASTDNTLQVLMNWEEQYPESILVINCEKNGKQGAARNTGMQYASGEYIAFVDDDDILELDMYETMYANAIDSQVDLVVCGSVKEYSYTPAKNHDSLTDSIKTIHISSNLDRLDILNNHYNIAIWNKLYKKQLLLDNEIFFPPGYIYDDIFFTGFVMQYITSICILPHIFYHHIISDSSVSFHANPSEKIGFIEVHIMLLEELQNRNLYQSYKEWFDQQFIIDFLTFYTNYEKSFGPLPSDVLRILKETICQLLPDLSDIPIVKKIISTDKKPLYKSILLQLIE